MVIHLAMVIMGLNPTVSTGLTLILTPSMITSLAQVWNILHRIVLNFSLQGFNR